MKISLKEKESENDWPLKNNRLEIYNIDKKTLI